MPVAVPETEAVAGELLEGAEAETEEEEEIL